MRRIVIIGFVFAICLFIISCSANNEHSPIEHEPPTDTSKISVNPSPQTSAPATPTEESENVRSSNYSRYLGIWRGYAILIVETLVITDVVENEITFLFVNVWCAKGSPNTASPVYTMPIIDNQIILVDERIDDRGEQFTITQILTFYDDYINLYRKIGTNEYGIGWQLTPLWQP